jgi:tetratricopeptide (TPR) repeat protein
MRRIILIVISLLAFMLCFAKSNLDKLSDYVLTAHKYAKERNYEQALKYIDKALKIDPEYLPCYLARAHYYEDMDEYLNAYDEINNAIELREDIYLYFVRYRILLRLYDYENAKRDSLYITNFPKRTFKDYSSAASFNIYCGNYNKAIEYIEKGLDDNILIDHFLFLSSIANFYLCKYEESLFDIMGSYENLEKDNLLFPSERYLWMTIIYYENGKESEAIDSLRKSKYNANMLSEYSHILQERYFMNKANLDILTELYNNLN